MMRRLLGRLSGPALRGTLWMLAGFALRQASQLTAFVLLVRIIGAQGFGAYTAVLALALLLSPFVELGGYSLVVRDLGRGDSVPRAVGTALGLSLASLPAVLLLFALLKPLMFPTVPWVFVACVAVGELLANRVLNIAVGVHVARGQPWRNTVMESALGFARLGAVLLLLAFGGTVTLLQWGYVYLAQVTLGAVAVLLWMSRTWGAPSLRLPRPLGARLTEGLHFSLGAAAQSAYAETDKVLLGRLGSLTDTGIFGAAQRIVNLANLPLFALLTTVHPKFFEHGRQGYGAARRYALKLLPITAAYGALMLLLFWFAAPYVPRLLGSSFDEAGTALRWLAVLTLVNALHYPLADALTGSGHQRVRSRLYLATFAANVALNVVLIPRFGWLGAAAATLAVQSVLLVALLILRPRPDTATPEPSATP